MVGVTVEVFGGTDRVVSVQLQRQSDNALLLQNVSVSSTGTGSAGTGSADIAYSPPAANTNLELRIRRGTDGGDGGDGALVFLQVRVDRAQMDRTSISNLLLVPLRSSNAWNLALQASPWPALAAMAAMAAMVVTRV